MYIYRISTKIWQGQEFKISIDYPKFYWSRDTVLLLTYLFFFVGISFQINYYNLLLFFHILSKTLFYVKHDAQWWESTVILKFWLQRWDIPTAGCNTRANFCYFMKCLAVNIIKRCGFFSRRFFYQDLSHPLLESLKAAVIAGSAEIMFM